jgi:hypothetical protein
MDQVLQIPKDSQESILYQHGLLKREEVVVRVEEMIEGEG